MFKIKAVRPALVIMLASVFLLIGFDAPLWMHLASITESNGSGMMMRLAFALLIACAFNLLITLFTFGRTLKPTLTLLFVISAGAAYFMNQYGVLIDVGTIRNVAQTDTSEVQGLLSASLLGYLLALGVLLRRNGDKVDSAMIYLADHGESLGEYNLYLHGTPYLLAPEEQKHVPMITWFSEGYQRAFQLDSRCLQAKRDVALSQDNLFHSLLRLLKVNTQAYESSLDLFMDCRGQGQWARQKWRRRFYEACRNEEKVSPLVRQLPWPSQ